ncbi:MAG TPA: response regulator transcription factor [Pseudonocardiaceae bacterium]
MTGQPIRVLVADDQRVVRDGLAMLLDLLPDVEVLAAAADGQEAITLALRLRPDVVLMDLRMPRCDGVAATRQLHEQAPDITVIVLTTYADDRSVLDALRAGARGYLTKDSGADQIHQALRRVTSGQAAIDPAVAHHLVDEITAHPPRPAPSPIPDGPTPRPDGLTPREVDVLTLIANGLTNGEVAATLFVSEATVKSHLNHLLAKIGAGDRAQAVTYAYRNGLVPPQP